MRIPTRGLSFVVLGLLVLTSCQPGARTRALPSPNTVGFPRCLASDRDGNQVACAAPARAHDGDGCACANGHGLAFYGQVQEDPR
jgi:hypothetical protein